MKRRTRFGMGALAPLLAVTAILAAPAGSMTFTETFEGGNNTGGWTFGNTFYEAILPTGGNPGAFLRNDFLDSFAPSARTTLGVDSPFTGDYRARGVTAVEADFALFYVDSTSLGRPVTLILYSDAGTPDDASDDCSVYFKGGKPAPQPNGQWNRYRFRVPADAGAAPRRWAMLGCGGRTIDEAWNLVVTDVDRLRFFIGDPELFYIFQVWDIGLDNPSITWGTPEPEPLEE